jgi:hypothetical protein
MKLPKVGKEADKNEAVAARAVAEILRPILKEIDDTTKEMARQFGKGKNDVAFQQFAREFKVDRLVEALRDMVDKDASKQMSTEQGVKELMTLTQKSRAEQVDVLRQLLASEKFNTSLMKSFITDVAMKELGSLEQLVALGVLSREERRRAESEILRSQRDKDRIESRNRSEGRIRGGRRDEDESTGILSRIADRLERINDGSLFGGLGRAVEYGVVGLGTLGLASMLPKQVQEFVGDFTAAFTTIRKLMQSSFLAPMIKILDNLPILGLISRKIPLLSAVLAAMEILPKTLERFKSDGIWGALQEGLEDVYQFFVGDIVNLVAKLAENIKVGLFGPETAKNLHFEDFGHSLNAGLRQIIGDVVDGLKAAFQGDWKALDRAAYEALWSLVDLNLKSYAALFQIDLPETGTIRKVAEKEYAEFADAVMSWVDWFSVRSDDFGKWQRAAAVRAQRWTDDFRKWRLGAEVSVGQFWSEGLPNMVAKLNSVDIDALVVEGVTKLAKGILDWLYDNTVGKLSEIDLTGAFKRMFTPSFLLNEPTPSPLGLMAPTTSRGKKFESVEKLATEKEVYVPAGRLGGVRTSVQVNNRPSSAHVTNLSVSGLKSASPTSPLSSTFGGGSR